MPSAADFEKLGVFYLGRAYDWQQKKPQDGLILYDSKDLVTHAVCVGMTGSGKTGLCMALIEEAAIDGIPAIVIDPKGDLANLLLTFPALRPEDFRPWVNEDDARRKNLSADDYARQQAELWKKGLAAWGEDGARIQRLRDAADFAIYTPGSNAGIPLSILKSFAAPPPAILEDEELLRERIGTTATSLLGLLGIDADPIKSREHILISTILDAAWRKGQELDLAGLIQQIQTPPVKRVGVLDLEAFFPSKDRFALAMSLNNLLAAPGFGAWMEGEPLDIGASSCTRPGQAARRHLLDRASQRRRADVLRLAPAQPGAGLDAHAVRHHEPARAALHGRDLRLLPAGGQSAVEDAAADPAQAGPGLRRGRGAGHAEPGGPRLQGPLQHRHLVHRAPADRARQGARARRPRGRRGQRGPGLRPRGTRAHPRRALEPCLPDEQRARGPPGGVREPLGDVVSAGAADARSDQVADGRAPRRPGARDHEDRADSRHRRRGHEAGREERAGNAPAATEAAPTSPPGGGQRPLLPPDVPQHFVPARGGAPAGSSLFYRPMLVGAAQVRVADTRSGVDVSRDLVYLTAITDDAVPVDWSQAETVGFTTSDLMPAAEGEAGFAELPATASKKKSYDGWSKDFATWLLQSQKTELLRSPSLKVVSKPGESERDFRVRLQETARQERDLSGDALRQKYAPRQAALQERRRRAEQAVARESEQATQQGLQTAISVGATILGAFLGRKSINVGTIGRATTAARGAGRVLKETQDVGRAKETVAAVDEAIAALDAEFKAEADALGARTDPLTEPLETIALKPTRQNISVRLVALAWAPAWQDAAGRLTPAWE